MNPGEVCAVESGLHGEHGRQWVCGSWEMSDGLDPRPRAAHCRVPQTGGAAATRVVGSGRTCKRDWQDVKSVARGVAKWSVVATSVIATCTRDLGCSGSGESCACSGKIRMPACHRLARRACACCILPQTLHSCAVCSEGIILTLQIRRLLI